MRRYKAIVILTTVVILLSFLLVGCGVAPEKYDQMAAQLQTAQSEVAEMRGKAQATQAEKESLAAELKASQAKVAELQGQVNTLKGQVSGLKDQYELVGATPAETVANIVRYYHETHVYSAYDFFVCSDMASDVWNMLKAQGIKAVIGVGSKDTAIGDIVQSDHAWVLAEVSPGQYLALETTAGNVVPRSKNPLYYKCWYFNTPGELKSYQQLREEYNIRVDIHNQIVAQDREVVAEHNRATNQSTADKLKAVHDKLVELIKQQEAEMTGIMSQIKGLATELR